jgi:hypothetical protein
VFLLECPASSECRRGTINPNLSVLHRCLPCNVVLRRHMVRPRSCSLHPLHDEASSDLCFVATTPFGRQSDVSDGILWSTWCKNVESLRGHVRCYD